MLPDPSDADYERAIVASDCVLCLRAGSVGETNGPLLDALGAGRAVLATATGSIPEVAGDAALYCDGTPDGIRVRARRPLRPERSSRARAGCVREGRWAHVASLGRLARLAVSRGLRVNQAISLSVVVCTHNRPLDLERCLEGISGPRRPGRGHRRRLRLAASVPRARGRGTQHRIENLVYVREDRPGHSRARNRGIATASGDFIAFLDDDASPRPDWARRVVAPFEADPAIGCVGGACHPVFPDGAKPDWLSDRLLQFAAITRFGPEAREATSSAEWPFGANMAFRRRGARRGGAILGDAGTRRHELAVG